MSGGIQFTSVGGARVAYQLHGEGDVDLVYAPGLASHLDLTIEQPRYRHFMDGLARLGRVIRFDRRGSGISDALPPASGEGWELWADDLRAVLDDAGSERAVILATNDAGPAGILFAATEAARTTGLILFNTTARFLSAPDYVDGHDDASAQFVVDLLRQVWGTEDSVPILAPSLAGDEPFRRWYARFQRAACSPTEMADSLARLFQMDARHVLGEVRCPTLILHREGYGAAPISHGRYVAEHVPGAQFHALPGADAMIYTEAADKAVDLIADFLGRTPSEPPCDTAFATVLFTDIVSSTEQAFALGDQAWHRLLAVHDAAARDAVSVEAGRLIKTTGDGVLATFDAPTRAVAAARRLRDAVAPMGIEIRAGIHAGPIIRRPEGDVAGAAVHIASRVLGRARDGEILLSSAVVDLITDRSLVLTQRGVHKLKGVPQAQGLHAVAN